MILLTAWWKGLRERWIIVIACTLLFGCSGSGTPVLPTDTGGDPPKSNEIDATEPESFIPSASQNIHRDSEEKHFVENEVLVVLHDEAESLSGRDFFSEYPVEIIRTGNLRWGNLHRLAITDGTSVEAMCDRLGNQPEVRFAEPNFIRYFDEAPYWPNDPMWEGSDPGSDPRDSTFEQWGPAKLGASIVWNDSTGDEDIVVAIIDSGIRYDHEDLTDSLWINEDENPDNGIDDDNNGYIDDWWGWNCREWNNNPNDDGAYCHYHGTGCAGVVAAVQDNNKGISGVAPGVKVMAVKVLFANNYTSDETIAYALNYAAANDVDICSMSFGGTDVAEILETAINDAWDNGNGCLLLASSGNSNNTLPHYPASYDCVMSIGATIPFSRYGVPCDEGRIRPGWEDWWWGSNYGPGLNVMAFGEKYYSTYGSGPSEYWDGVNHNFFNGTSCACPNAAATMALIKSFHPNQTNQWYWDRLENTADDLDVPGFDIQTGNGRVNIVRAVYGADRYSSLEDTNGFVPITGAGDTLFDSINDRPGNPFHDTQDLYIITPDETGCLTVYLDIYTWGENLDVALYSDLAMSDLIVSSTIENHADSSWESLFTGVLADTNYYLAVYSPSEGNSTTYGVTVSFSPNTLTVTGESIAPGTVQPGTSGVPLLKITLDVLCSATLTELTAHMHGAQSEGGWGTIKLYIDEDGNGIFDGTEPLLCPIGIQEFNHVRFEDLDTSWTEAGPLVLFLSADMITDIEIGSLPYIALDWYKDVKLIEDIEPDPASFPIISTPMLVIE